jgi:hypothetical protein
MRSSRRDGITVDQMNIALERWKMGWDLCTGNLAPEYLQQTGFMNDAAIEFWHLAKAILERAK